MAWYAKAYGAYSNTSNEAVSNAREMCKLLYKAGYSKASVAAILGNVSFEGGFNPWRWGDLVYIDFVPSYQEFQNWTYAQSMEHGYGLFQYTPANKYINNNSSQLYPTCFYPNFSDLHGRAEDGEGQTRYFIANASGDWSNGNYGYYYDDFSNIGVNITPWYYTTFDNFKRGINNSGFLLDLAALTGVFELCYERPGDTYAANSYQNRVNAANYWYGVIPNPSAQSSDSMSWIYYLKHRRF